MKRRGFSCHERASEVLWNSDTSGLPPSRELTTPVALVASYLHLTNLPKVIVCTPCPVYGSGAFDIRPGAVATNIAPTVRDLAARLGLQVIDLHTRLAGHPEWFPDTVHPNSKGMTAMAAMVYGTLTGSARRTRFRASLASTVCGNLSR